ncbi:MAG: asparaginase domain-containing protein [candidate division KSB1 bacterium]|nr:asparaginase domain-containing protein [candidate division KSB1 bacterium]
MKKSDIIVITTGGTIEKTYNEMDGSLSNRGSQLKKMLKRLRLPYTSITHHDLFYKDSLDMTDEDREQITQTTQQLLKEQKPIVILHGTDTMELTAEYMYNVLDPVPAPVVFTGAMTPFGFENSDALQNFTEALYASQIIDPGIYISMHGMLHSMPGVVKNRQTGTFVKRKIR